MLTSSEVKVGMKKKIKKQQYVHFFNPIYLFVNLKVNWR